VRQITARRTIVSITTVALFAWQLAGCAVLPERLSGFKEPTSDQLSNLDAATKYAQDVNGELLSLHDQYSLLEAALIAGALGSGVAFGVATAFNGSKDLLAALGLAGGSLVAIDYASSAPQKIKVISEGRSEILCAMNTAPLLTKVPAPSANPLAAGVGGNKFALMSATAGAAGSSSAAPAMFDLATSLQQVQQRAPMAMAFPAKQNAASLQAEAAANKTASASWNVVASQITATGIMQATDYNTALQQVYEIVPPSPAQYLSMTASDVAHSVFDLLDESNPSVSDVYNKAKGISPNSTANARAAIQKATASTQQAKSLVNSVQTVVTTAAAASDVPAPDPNTVAAKTDAANQTLDQNAQTLTVLSDMLQKAKDCKSMNSGVWNIGNGN
jgi:hypothetical protein